MPKVSRRVMNKQIEEKVLTLFSEVLGKLTRKEEIETFLSDFLSPTEYMMLAKRLAIVLLLSRGYNYEEIGNLLKVSSETVGRISLSAKRHGQGLKLAIDKILGEEKKKEFIMGLEKLLAKMIIAHPAAWGRINRYYDKRKRDSKFW